MEDKGKMKAKKDFRGLIWAPSYEQEVVLLFGLLLPYIDIAIKIDECRIPFPDCIAFRSNDNSKIRIEFELLSSNFEKHGHDPKKCDMIVCWLHNWPSCPQSIEILELSKIIRDKKLEFILKPNQTKYSKTIWDEKSFFNVLNRKPFAKYVREFYEFCKVQEKLSIRFGKGEKLASFQLFYMFENRAKAVLLGVYANNGKVWPGFMDENMPSHIQRGYRERLGRIERIRNDAMNKKWFEFIVQNKEELAVLNDTVRWLAETDW